MIEAALIAHHNALRHTRGIDCLYYPKGETEAIELRLVPGRTDAESVGGLDVTHAGRARDWLELRQTLEISLARMPEEGDQVVELGRDGSPARTWRVAMVGEVREWADHDTHGVVVRFHSIESPAKR